MTVSDANIIIVNIKIVTSDIKINIVKNVFKLFILKFWYTQIIVFCWTAESFFFALGCLIKKCCRFDIMFWMFCVNLIGSRCKLVVELLFILILNILYPILEAFNSF